MPIRRVQITELEARAAKLEKALKLATRTAQSDVDTAVFPTGRLTTTSGAPVITPDADAYNVYYTPYIGAAIPIFNGTTFVTLAYDELDLALDANAAHTNYHQLAKVFDCFVINDNGTIRLVSGPAWSSATSRGTGAGTTELERIFGIYTNKYDIASARYGSNSGDTVDVGANEGTYVGTFRTVGDGRVTDGVGSRYIWNAFNRVRKPLRRIIATDTWNYSTASWRAANGGSSSVDYVCGLSIDMVEASVYHMVFNSTSTARRVSTGIGIDSDTVNSAVLMNNPAVINQRANLSAHYAGYPGLGYHYLAWLEYGAGADTQTWYGDNGDATTMQSGLIGAMWC